MVLDLANRFRTEQGIDCQIDQHFLPAFPPEGWIKWMRDQITQADYVLLVCTPVYRDRYERNVETGGNGVAFEGLIISEILYKDYFKSLKFIPVICDVGKIEHVSPELRGKNIYKIPSDAQKLADLINGRRYHPLPPLSLNELDIEHSTKEATQSSLPKNQSLTSQREAEIVYLNNLLRQREANFVSKTYITLSGDYQPDRQTIPDDMIPISFRYHSGKDSTHKFLGDVTHCKDLIAAFERYQRLVILGEPGAGKTFSLWKIAAEKASSALNEQSHLIPIVVPLNKWTDASQSLEDFIIQQMGAIGPFFSLLTQQKRLLPLLDALNEIPFSQREVKLPQVKLWIDKDFPSLVISCRERDYTRSLIQDIDRLEIEPLDPPRVYDFLKSYFYNLHQSSNNSKEIANDLFWRLTGDGESIKKAWLYWQDPRTTLRIRLQSTLGKNIYHTTLIGSLISLYKRIHHLWAPFTKPSWENFWVDEKQINDWYWENRSSWGYETAREAFFKDSRCLMKLAQNPYLLKLIIFIYHENQQKLPENRSQLFSIFVSDLLEREMEDSYKAQGRNLALDQEAIIESLKTLAWYFQGQTRKNEASTTLMTHEVLENKIITENELKLSAAASILELTDETVRFSHQLLQEYFTAQSFEKMISEGLKASKLWPSETWWEINGWEEATKLAANHQQNLPEFLNWLAEGNPRLAAEIAILENLLDQKNYLFGEYKVSWNSIISNTENYQNLEEIHALSTTLAWLDWDDRIGIGANHSKLPDIDWVEIPEGEFIYGEEDTEQSLSIGSFSVSRFPITNKQFQLFVQAGGYETEEWWKELTKPEELPDHKWKEGNRPVEGVDWCESIAFCRWLSFKTGENISLPTEQQWEKSARGTEANKYSWGNKYIAGFANVSGTFDDDSIRKYNLQETSAVGIYPQAKSPYEIMDMCGNVWEWCLDQYEEEEEEETADSDESGVLRVVRGGSWVNSARDCHTTFRNFGYQKMRYDDQGFRLVRNK